MLSSRYHQHDTGYYQIVECDKLVLMQRELKAARKALKKSLKELDSAEADRSHLQRQVNKLSQTLQVSSSSWYNFLVQVLGTTS